MWVRGSIGRKEMIVYQRGCFEQPVAKVEDEIIMQWSLLVAGVHIHEAIIMHSFFLSPMKADSLASPRCLSGLNFPFQFHRLFASLTKASYGSLTMTTALSNLSCFKTPLTSTGSAVVSGWWVFTANTLPLTMYSPGKAALSVASQYIEPVFIPVACSSRCLTHVLPEPWKLASATIGLLPGWKVRCLKHVSSLDLSCSILAVLDGRHW